MGRPDFREKMLVTHRGLSGPAILQISSYWKPAESIRIDLAPGRDVTAELFEPAAAAKCKLRCELRCEKFFPTVWPTDG